MSWIPFCSKILEQKPPARVLPPSQPLAAVCLCPEGAPRPRAVGSHVHSQGDVLGSHSAPPVWVPWGWAWPFSEFQVPTHRTIDQRALSLHPGKPWEGPRVSVSDTQRRPSQCTGEKWRAAEIIVLIRAKEEGRKVNQLVSCLSCYRPCSGPTE